MTIPRRLGYRLFNDKRGENQYAECEPGAGLARWPGASILLPRFARAAEINWKFTSSQPAVHPSTVRYLEAAERVKQKSNGRFEIAVFHSGQLGTDIDTFTQVRIGGVHMMVFVERYNRHRRATDLGSQHAVRLQELRSGLGRRRRQAR